MKIFDCFPFLDELDVLDLRLQELDPVVDRFVLLEATYTHTGQPKPLYYQENAARFAAFHDKIIHVLLDDIGPELAGRTRIRSNEIYHRECLVRGLDDAAPSDLVIIADVDEIPSRKAIQTVRDSERLRHRAVQFRQRLHYYYLDCVSYQTLSYHPVIAPAHLVNLCGAQAIRGLPWETMTAITDAGWHFSYFGGVKAIQQKMMAYADVESNVAPFNQESHIDYNMRAGMDPIGRDIPCGWIPFDESFPETVKANVEKYVEMGWFRHPPVQNSGQSA